MIQTDADSGRTTRRTFLTRSAAVAGGAMALSVASGPLTTFAARRGTPTPVDEDVLNYALTLEHLEANFYVEAVNRFGESDIENYIRDQGFGNAVASGAYQRIVNVRDHEVTHVETLQQVIQGIGGTPVPPCTYDFSGALADVPTFLATSMVLENTGVRAYDGAIALIASPDLQTAGATIATVEARHASYFNLLNKRNPFPAAFDQATAPQRIINEVLATGLIVSCPVPPPVPDNPNRPGR